MLGVCFLNYLSCSDKQTRRETFDKGKQGGCSTNSQVSLENNKKLKHRFMQQKLFTSGV